MILMDDIDGKERERERERESKRKTINIVNDIDGRYRRY